MGPDGQESRRVLVFDPTDEVEDSNLWAARVDLANGLVRGEPERLTNWAGFLRDQSVRWLMANG
jgi:hypothetical protein